MKLENKRGLHGYTISNQYEAGIELLGAEVKSIRNGRISLAGAFIKIIDSQAYLVNADIQMYSFARPEGYDAKRSRRLLLHRKEIITIKSKLDQKGWTVIPTSIYFKKGLVKVGVGLGRGKHEYEKREEIKKRDTKRELDRLYRGKIRY